MLKVLCLPINATTKLFEKLTLVGSLSLAVRIYLFRVFFVAGLTKYNSWQTTLILFENEYNVPLLPYKLAAQLGTAAELILPVVLLLGVATRLTAFSLFVFNLVAVIAYSHFLFGDNGFYGLVDHIIWGYMCIALMAVGGGKFTMDALFKKVCPNYKA